MAARREYPTCDDSVVAGSGKLQMSPVKVLDAVSDDEHAMELRYCVPVSQLAVISSQKLQPEVDEGVSG